MKNQEPTKERRPENGCARCVWWLQERNSSWGRCCVHKSRTWWQAPSCVEYERDGQIDDDILVYHGKDVSHG